MKNDLVERLRIGSANLKAPWQKDDYSLCDEAMDEIIRLRAICSELADMLQQIADTRLTALEAIAKWQAYK